MTYLNDLAFINFLIKITDTGITMNFPSQAHYCKKLLTRHGIIVIDHTFTTVIDYITVAIVIIVL